MQKRTYQILSWQTHYSVEYFGGSGLEIDIMCKKIFIISSQFCKKSIINGAHRFLIK